ncbi:hypothetical protein OCU04_009829 [Sclerotinia nivalis]|uniref:Integrase zinc-binding domain-containing protein n=1 Tax=Sclerotinia nivalis TaxID=352851 RepID=A0A9X0AGP5_9HELO|nr:hypothetical protein OCU04_009829 [Sclerotinia nivalis]
MVTKPARADKIRNFRVPYDAKGVRRFLATIQMTRRYIKNFAEISCPLARLTGNIDGKWASYEHLAFGFLREKCFDDVENHGVDYRTPIEMYTDASKFGAGCFITQKRPAPETDNPLISYPILYDSFLFNSTQLNYNTYKHELLATAEFVGKYHYYFRYSEHCIVWTNHLPLVSFLSPSSETRGIYARQAMELSSLGIQIKQIKGKRNKVADALSRTIFPDAAANSDDVIDSLGTMGSNSDGPCWICKDSIGGYEELLAIRDTERLQPTVLFSNNLLQNDESLNPVVNSVTLEDHPFPDLFEDNLFFRANNIEYGPIASRYDDDEWYGDIHHYITTGKLPDGIQPFDKAIFLRNARKYSLFEGELFFCLRDVEKKCILKSEVSDVLAHAHDLEGHYAAELTVKKLRFHYWLQMISDIKAYILDCLRCAKHGIRCYIVVTRSFHVQSLSRDWLGKDQ